jgi:hypothetical protein
VRHVWLVLGGTIVTRAAVERALGGKRGQAFLTEMAAALDAMTVKELVGGDLVREDGAVCAIGAVAVARGKDVSTIDPWDEHTVAITFGIATSMAREIVWENDECGRAKETPSERWTRMRAWVEAQLGRTGGGR